MMVRNCCVFVDMNELLFECYAFPQVAYGIDSMFSFFKNFQNLGKSLL